MAMDDEETVALIVGGHTFGKCHGAVDPDSVGPEPEGCPIEAQGIGWKVTAGTGMGADTITSGLEGAWTNEPTTWDNGYLDNLLGYDYEKTTSPAGAQQYTPTNPEAQDTVPDAHDPSKRHAPMMLTTDLALKVDPIYAPIVQRFHEHPDQLADAFARAWYKLLHRDMGPLSRYLGPWVPEPQLWQDPVPAADGETIGDRRHRHPQAQAARVGALRLPARVHRVGVGGQLPRHRQAGWGERGAHPPRAAEGLGGQRPERAGQGPADPRRGPAGLQRGSSGGAKVSLADLIVLGGCAAVEQAAKNAGHNVTVPFAPGRTDASQEQTDVDSFAVLEPAADGFRNYLRAGEKLPPETLLLDRANLLTLTPPEMTVLVGGMRALNTNFGHTAHGVFTDRPETLTNDFFVHLLDMGTEWKTSASEENVYEGRDRATGEVKGTATAVDLVFGSNSQLRAIAEEYASDGGEEMFVRDFVAAWDKVMNLDRFDLA